MGKNTEGDDDSRKATGKEERTSIEGEGAGSHGPGETRGLHNPQGQSPSRGLYLTTDLYAHNSQCWVHVVLDTSTLQLVLYSRLKVNTLTRDPVVRRYLCSMIIKNSRFYNIISLGLGRGLVEVLFSALGPVPSFCFGRNAPVAGRPLTLSMLICILPPFFPH